MQSDDKSSGELKILVDNYKYGHLGLGTKHIYPLIQVDNENKIRKIFFCSFS
jgi:hypothetical protein